MASSDSSVDALIMRLGSGDQRALAELFQHYRSRLRRMVVFRLDERLRERVDPSDVLQEAYLAASQGLRRFLQEPSMTFFVWLREVTVQRLMDVHRRHLETQKRDSAQAWSRNTSIALAQQLAAHVGSPSELMLRIERAAQLREALESMEPMDREVLALRHFEELTNDEVAEILDIERAAASNRYLRALGRLKKILETIPGFFDELQG